MRCDMPNCIGGFIFDPYTKTKTPCPKCAERKEGELADGEVQRKLKLPEGMTNNKAFDERKVFSEEDLKTMTQESLDYVCSSMKSLITDIVAGNKPTYSTMFYFGRAAFTQNFINPLLVKAYLTNLTVTPVIDVATLCKLRQLYETPNKMDSNLKQQLEGTEVNGYEDFLSSDVCVIYAEAGLTLNSKGILRGLVQLRARRNLATIIVIDDAPGNFKDFYINNKNYDGLYPMSLCSVKYESMATAPSTTPNARVLGQLTPEEMRSL